MIKQWCWHCGGGITEDTQKIKRYHRKGAKDVYFHKDCMKPYRQQLFRHLLGW